MTSKVETIKPSRIILLFIGLLILMGLVAYVVTEFNYQVRINSLKNEVNKVWQDVVKPAGGVEQSAIYVEAPFWFTSFCIDTGPCPEVSEPWLLLVEQDGRSRFMDEAVRKEGISKENTLNRDIGNEVRRNVYRGNIVLELSITPVTNEKPPHPAPAGKEWVVFNVAAYNRAGY